MLNDCLYIVLCGCMVALLFAVGHHFRCWKNAIMCLLAGAVFTYMFSTVLPLTDPMRGATLLVFTAVLFGLGRVDPEPAPLFGGRTRPALTYAADVESIENVFEFEEVTE